MLYHSGYSPLAVVLILGSWQFLGPSFVSAVIFHLFLEFLPKCWSIAFSACSTPLGFQRISQLRGCRRVFVGGESRRLWRSAAGLNRWSWYQLGCLCWQVVRIIFHLFWPSRSPFGLLRLLHLKYLLLRCCHLNYSSRFDPEKYHFNQFAELFAHHPMNQLFQFEPVRRQILSDLALVFLARHLWSYVMQHLSRWCNHCCCSFAGDRTVICPSLSAWFHCRNVCTTFENCSELQIRGAKISSAAQYCSRCPLSRQWSRQRRW